MLSVDGNVHRVQSEGNSELNYGIQRGRLRALGIPAKAASESKDDSTEPVALPWWFWQVGTASGQFQAPNRSEARALLKRKIAGPIPRVHRLEKVEGQRE